MQPQIKGKLPLELTLEAELTEVPLDQAVRVTLILRNISRDNILVNRRLLLNHPAAVDSAREIVLEVSGPPGYVNLKKFHVNAGPPGPDQFQSLQPGATVQREYDLSPYFSLHLAGTYVLEATYANQCGEPVKGQMPWVGVLKAAPIKITRV